VGTPDSFTNLNSGTGILSGGSYTIGGTMLVDGGAGAKAGQIAGLSGAALTFDGPAGTLANGPSSTPFTYGGASGFSVDQTSVLTAQNGAAVTLNGPLVNNGTVTSTGAGSSILAQGLTNNG